MHCHGLVQPESLLAIDWDPELLRSRVGYDLVQTSFTHLRVSVLVQRLR